ncbi:MAG TPA: hypothetical protein VHF06_23705 [Pseudonocardiaceae bacterium]|nr:hypothetical protein [Pseudonocardiaceae bacterium]
MTSIQTLEGGFGETLYRLHRRSVKTDLRMERVLTHLGITDMSDDEVEAALDEQ